MEFITKYIFPLLPGILTSIIATGICALFVCIYDKYKKSKSPYTGDWESSIYNESGNEIKSDILHLKERNGKIKGTMERVIPKDQSSRRWIVLGYVKNAHILLSIVPQKETQASDGGVYVALNGDQVYDGYYLKKIGDDKIISTPIQIRLKKEK